jgi:hypothetical protein
MISPYYRSKPKFASGIYNPAWQEEEIFPEAGTPFFFANMQLREVNFHEANSSHLPELILPDRSREPSYRHLVLRHWPT